MDCAQEPWLSNTDYLTEFRRRTYQERIPISGGINLTNRCNLKCVHCYIHDCTCGDGDASELATEKILSILDEAAAEGCLSFLITGGEPLLHPDFAVVYSHARRLGMLVWVFTNGTLLNESHIQLFKEMPPRGVEITLYGGTEDTFDRVAGVTGAYAACHRGIQLLVDGKVPFRLKAMLLTLNQHELGLMQAFASELGVEFRFDSIVNPALDGDLSPLQYRVEPEDAVQAEMADRKKAIQKVEYDRTLGESYREDYLYRCGSGTTNFFVGASGGLQPCLMVTDHSVNLNEESFRSGWQKLNKIRDIKAPPDLPCRSCPDLPYCGYCPPSMILENGLQVSGDSFICRLGHQRREAVKVLAQELS